MENNSLDIGISEKCTFCMESFSSLREFVKHLDGTCEVKKDLDKNKTGRNNEQRLIILRKDELRKHSTKQLNQEREKFKGTKGEDTSVAGDIRS